MADFPFTHLSIDVDDVSAHPDAVSALFSQQLDLLIIRRALPDAALSRLVATLDRLTLEEDVPWTPQQFADPHKRQMMLIGESLTPNISAPNGPELGRYLRKARWVEDFVAQHGPPCFQTFEGILRALGAPSPTVAQDHLGNRYTPGTFRKLPAQCAIPLHVGNYFFDTGGYTHLRSSLDTTLQLSYFYTLRPAHTGGELAVYSTRWSDPHIPWLEEHNIWDSTRILSQSRVRHFKPQAGDLLLFNGGHYFHRVTPVDGPHSRWTLGGFFARTQAGTIAYWN